MVDCSRNVHILGNIKLFNQKICNKISISVKYIIELNYLNNYTVLLNTKIRTLSAPSAKRVLLHSKAVLPVV